MLITKVRLDQVQPHPHNIRRDVGDVTELAESLKSSGMLQPLVVAPLVGAKPRAKNAPMYVLIAGHRRLAAAKECGWADVEVIVRDDLDTEGKQTEAMLVENLQRTNLTPVEEAHGYQQLLDFGGYTVAKVAKATGRNPRTVKLRLGLTRLSDKASEKLHTGQITLEQAEVLASFAKNPKAYAELEKTIGTSNFAWQVQRVKEKQAKDAKRQKLFEQLRTEGVTRIEEPRAFPWSSTEKPLSAKIYGPAHGLDIEPADHVSCPGHAAIVISDYRGDRIDYVCTDPIAHGHVEAKNIDVDAGIARKSREEYSANSEATASEAQRSARARQRADDLRTAQVTRREFAKELVKRQRLAPAVECALLRSLLIRRVEELVYNDWDVELAELLRLDPAVFLDDDKDAEDRLAEFIAYIDLQLDATDLFKVLLVVHVIDADPLFGWSDDYVPAYFAMLFAAGYEMSDVERAELLAAHPPKVSDDGPAVEDVVRAGEFADAI